MHRKMYRKIPRTILGITLATGLGAAAFALADRDRGERRLDAVEIAGDYHGLADLAAAAGRDFGSAAAGLKKAGLTSLVVGETTLDRLAKLGAARRLTLGGLALEHHLTGPAAGPAAAILARYADLRAVAGYQVFFFDDPVRFRLAEAALRAECGRAVKAFAGGPLRALVVESARDLGSLGLGYDPRELAEVRGTGLTPVLLAKCPEAFAGWRLAALTATARAWGARLVLLMQSRTGARRTGARTVRSAAAALAAAGLAPCLRESNGLAEEQWAAPLAAAADYRVAKYFLSLQRYVQGKGVTTADVVDQWARTVAERHVRVLYVRPLLRPDRAAAANLNETAAAVKGLAERLRNLGLHPGRAGILSFQGPSRPVRAAAAAGIAAGVLLFCAAVMGGRSAVPVFVLPVAAAAIALAELSPLLTPAQRELFRQAAALAAACTFPSLAAAHLTGPRGPGRVAGPRLAREAARLTLSAIGLAAAGGILAAAMLSSAAYLLKFAIFRGVKLALVLPIGIAGLLYAARIGFWTDGEGRPLPLAEQGRRFLRHPLRLGDLLIALALVGAFLLLWVRSGNTVPGLVSGLEMKFRAALERTLVARPRTKELLAFPLLMLYPWFRVRGRKFPAALCLLAGMAGLAGVVNSFVHLRCPIGLTVRRAAYSAGFGLATGLLLLGLAILAEKAAGRRAGRPADYGSGTRPGSAHT